MILCDDCRVDISREEFYTCRDCAEVFCRRDAEDHEHIYFTEYCIGHGNKIEETDEFEFKGK